MACVDFALNATASLYICLKSYAERVGIAKPSLGAEASKGLGDLQAAETHQQSWGSIE